MLLYNEQGNKINSLFNEVIDQNIASQYIKKNDTVLELGARYGSVSILVNDILEDKSKHVVVEPDRMVWKALEKNRDEHKSQFKIIKGFLSDKRFSLEYNGYESYMVEDDQSIIPSVSLYSLDVQFDTLIADCEGGLKQFFEEYGFMYNKLKKVIMEEDGDIDYKPIKVSLMKRGFTRIYEHMDYDGLVHSVWVKVSHQPINSLLVWKNEPAKIYVVHCDQYKDRRLKLEEQFTKFGIQNVEWVTDYPKDHPLVQEWKTKTGTKMSESRISGSLKHYEALRRMCEENIDEAIIFEDDVILTEFFDISKIPRQNIFVRLCQGVPEFGIQPGNSTITVYNNGGVEAYYIRLEFAREFLKNITLLYAVDIEYHGFLYHNNFQHIPCVPMCTQIYDVTNYHDEYELPWLDYVMKWNTLPKFIFK